MFFLTSLSQTASADVNNRLLRGLTRGIFNHRETHLDLIIVLSDKFPSLVYIEYGQTSRELDAQTARIAQRVLDSAPCYPDPVLHSTLSLSSRSPSLVSALLCPIDITCDCVFLLLFFLHQSSLETRLLDCEP